MRSEQAYYQMGSEYFPKFLSGIPFTPVNRSKFIYSNKTIDAKGIIQPLEDFLEKSKVSSFHINFISQNTSENLMNNNFFQRVGIQYHWKNNSFSTFNDFLDTMKSRKKKYSKRKKFLKRKRNFFYSQRRKHY